MCNKYLQEKIERHLGSQTHIVTKGEKMLNEICENLYGPQNKKVRLQCQMCSRKAKKQCEVCIFILRNIVKPK